MPKGDNMRSHGMTKTHFYKRFATIKYRCDNPNADNYKFYGAKGTKVLWKNFEEFKEDMYTSYLEHVKKFGKENTTIDRVNNSGHYCKENCRWETWKNQHRNTTVVKMITFNGKTLDIREWAAELGLHPQTLYSRLDKLKMPIELALTSKKFGTAVKWQKQI